MTAGGTVEVTLHVTCRLPVMDDYTAAEVATSVVLAALRDGSIEVTRFTVEATDA